MLGGRQKIAQSVALPFIRTEDGVAVTRPGFSPEKQGAFRAKTGRLLAKGGELL
jgi:hypothetical protein